MKAHVRTAFRLAVGAYVVAAGAVVAHEWRYGIDAETRMLTELRDSNRERNPEVTREALERLKARFPERGNLESARAVLSDRLTDKDRVKAEATLRSLVNVPGNTGMKAQYVLGLALLDSSRSAVEQAEGLALVKQAAEAGEGRAQTTYASLLAEGTRGPRDLKLARDYYVQAAKKVPEAALALAQLYGGESLPAPNIRSREDLARRALDLLKQDSDSGNLTSTLQLADILSGADSQVADLIPVDVAEAEKRYALAADAGSGIAVVKLALLLRDKVATEDARARASVLLRKAADSGSGEALLELGKGYRDGLYGEPDPIEAVNFYRRAAESGLSGGMVLLGKAYMYGQGVAVDTKLGLDWVRRAADAGNPAAKVELGVLHHKGVMVPQDDKQAYDWYIAGAKAGNPSGMAAVSRALARGVGVERNLNESLSWAVRAVDAGIRAPDLLSLVGRAYATGERIPQNTEKAIRWLTLAAEKDDSDAMIELGRLLLLTDRAPPEVAVEWFRRAELLGNGDSLMAIGRVYASGLGVPVDERKAFEYFQRAAHLGSLTGVREVGNSYAVGFGVPKNPSVAIDWFRKAAELGDGKSMLSLYDSYHNGSGVAADKKMALEWLRRSAAANNPSAQYRLGLAYLTGTDVKADRAEARKYFEAAAAVNFAPAKLAVKTLLNPSQVVSYVDPDEQDE